MRGDEERRTVTALEGDLVGIGGHGMMSDRREPVDERVASGDVTAHLFWRPALPSAESPPRRLVSTLTGRGLLLEPFERALAGLDEAFSGA